MRKLTTLLLMMLVGLLCPSAFAQTSHEFDVDEDRPFITDVSQLSSPWDAPHEWEGNQAHLLDGDPETYWHTNWNKNTEKHYLQVALNEPIHELIAMKVIRRHMNYNKTALCVADHVTKWGIYGADSPDAEDSGWTELGMFDTPYNEPGETLITDAFDTKGKQYLRIYAEATNTGNRFWHAAELQLYPIVEIDEMTAALREASELFNRHLNELYYLQENVGTEPGQYEKEAVDAFAAAMDAVSALDEMGGTYTLEDVKTIIETLKSTYQAAKEAIIPFTLEDGYYRIRHSCVFYNNVPTGEVDEEGNPLTELREVSKYMYSVLEGETYAVRWNTPSENGQACPYLWKVTNKDGYFDVMNCATDTRFNEVPKDNRVSMSPDATNLIAIEMVHNVNGYPHVTMRVSTQAGTDHTYLHPLSHGIQASTGQGNGTEGYIIGWANDTYGVSEWVFEPVSDDEAADIMEEYEPYKDRAMMVENFKMMREDAEKKLEIAKDLSVRIYEEKPFITDVEQLSSPWSEPELDEGYLSYLLDDDPETYWHTNWHSSVAAHLHYLQVALNEPVHQLISMKFTRRLHNYRRTALQTSDHVTLWSICASDDPEAEDEAWVELVKLSTPYNEPGETIVTQPFDTQGKQYLRLYADATNSNRGYWHIAALQFYPGEVVDPATSQYHVMGAIGTALDNALQQLKDVEADEVTVEQYDLLKNAYEPFAAKFVNPEPLRTKMEEVKDAADIIAIGTDPGFWKDDKVAKDLDKAIADAKNYDALGNYTQESSDAYINNLDAAVANIKTTAIPVQTGKWYRIRFGSEEEYAEHNWNNDGNEPNYRVHTEEGYDPDTTAVLHEALFGKYMTVAQLERIDDEDDYGEFTRYAVVPLDKDEVAIGNQLFCDDEEDIEDPDMALFRFISLGDTAYIIQNKATGLYLQKKPESNDGIYLSVHPSLFTQEVAGYGQNAFFIKTLSNEAQNPLHFARNTNVVITYGRYGDTDGRRGCFFVETAGDVASDYAPNATRIRVWEGAMTARCYPVTMTAIDKELGQMWTVSGIEREAATDDTPAQLKVTLTRFADNTVPAGQPFIYVEGGDYIPVEERSEDDEPLLVDVTFGNDFVAEPQNSGALKGVFTRTTIGEGALNVGDTKFTITTSTAAAVDTNGAYIVDEEEVPRNYQVVAIFDDEGNGITETLQTLTRSTDVYTIDGRLVRKGGNLNSLCNAQPGIYIVGGVKVVVR